MHMFSAPLFLLTLLIGFAAQHMRHHTPQYLYKVLSSENWDKSQSQDLVALPKEDQEFIHLAKQDQLDRIIDKYWSTVPRYVILKIDTAKLPGRLVYEANPGGTHKYYHLYDGNIPLKAIVEAKKINKDSSLP